MQTKITKLMQSIIGMRCYYFTKRVELCQEHVGFVVKKINNNYLNTKNIYSKAWYLLIGVIMWVAMLKSGVHATLVGILLAFYY